MSEKLRIIPLGGLNEIGKNMTVLEYGRDMIVVDCGLGFPEDDMYGVDLVIPDVSYLVSNQKKLRGFFITHGHEDHLGSTLAIVIILWNSVTGMNWPRTISDFILNLA